MIFLLLRGDSEEVRGRAGESPKKRAAHTLSLLELGCDFSSDRGEEEEEEKKKTPGDI